MTLSDERTLNMVYEYNCGHWYYLLFPNIGKVHYHYDGKLVRVDDVSLETIAGMLTESKWVKR